MLRFERRWAHDVMSSFAPPGGPGLAPDPGRVDFVGALRTQMRASTPLAALGLRLAVWMAALAPLWTLGRLRTIRGLRPAERAAVLARLLRSRLYLVRELTLFLKLAACFALFRVPELRAQSHYDPAQADEGPPAASGVRRRLPVVATGGAP
ncbi:MAG: hypothetical protein NZ898_08325 [Myxococcota bacterium]|nr:hypothetical protein [Myxococcota bacterium]MDW8361910.1 hypothetical protein [Myxococcales bacterium]